MPATEPRHASDVNREGGERLAKAFSDFLNSLQ
jgi:hypothetical protein